MMRWMDKAPPFPPNRARDQSLPKPIGVGALLSVGVENKKISSGPSPCPASCNWKHRKVK